MIVALSGHSGLIGSSLEKLLELNGYRIVRLTRELLYDSKGTRLIQALNGVDAVVHLAGAPILKRWTEKNRALIFNSRINTTQNLCKAVRTLPSEGRPKLIISASAIGIYQPGIFHTEESKDFAGHFAAQVTRSWEEASENLPSDVRRVVFRIGLVIDKDALLVKQLKLPFKLFLGGPIGSGNQPFPFIHLDDVTGAVLWALQNDATKGIYNLVAPGQVTNKEFSKQFGLALNRPSWLPVPKFPLKIMFGQAAQLVYESPGVVPQRLLKENYSFKYPEVVSAIGEAIK